ncbi:MAG: acyltransferase family protein [Deferribacterales bacterium]
MKYRTDIDGLRTMAILPVIFYHAGMNIFSGGYVGVDIFFVISGYLITSIIVKELNDDRFTIANFYVRRVKRIFPALYFLLSFTFILSFFSLMPAHFEAFGKSVVSTVLFSSNILFWSESGYFESAAETKPLLHTWSLGVEEQFYIFFPVILMLVARYGSKKYIRWALGIFIISLGFSVWSASAHPEAGFYLIPFRSWELMIGALIALGFYYKTDKPLHKHIMSVTGFVMLLMSIFMFDKSTPFPSYRALLPCVGTALIIISEGGIINRMLSWRPIVWIGLLSYSLYLWHWVLFALRNYWENVHIPEFYKSNLFLIFLTFAFASFSYYVVEKPLRVAKIQRKRLFFSVTFAVMAVFTLIGGYTAYDKGMPGRIPDVALEYTKSYKSAFEIPACYGYAPEKVTYDGLCRLGDKDAEPSFILWGDSHALVFSDGFDKLAKEQKKAGILAVRAACAPLLGVTRPSKPKYFKCIEFNDRIAEIIRDNKNLKNVLISARWESGAEGDAWHFLLSDAETPKPSKEESFRAYDRGIERTVKLVTGLDRELSFIMDNPEFAYDVPRELAKQSVLKYYLPALAGSAGVFSPYERYEERNAKVLSSLNRLKEKYDFTIIDTASAACPDGRCVSEADGRSLYSDDNHLSPFGSVYLVEKMADMLKGRI